MFLNIIGWQPINLTNLSLFQEIGYLLLFAGPLLAALAIAMLAGVFYREPKPSGLTGTENWTEADWRIHHWLKGDGDHPSDLPKPESTEMITIRDAFRPGTTIPIKVNGEPVDIAFVDPDDTEQTVSHFALNTDSVIRVIKGSPVKQTIYEPMRSLNIITG